MNFIERLNGDLREYASIPFWSWNDRLEPNELRRQIQEMKKAAIGGFFMHARGGLETEYLSDEWFQAVDVCCEEAKKQGMDAWVYDENGWPSGFAGMKLLDDPENHVHYLTCEAVCDFDPEALACFRVEEGELIRVKAPEGESCVAIYDKTNSSQVDILNWRVVRKFIDETHEKYAERFGDGFRNAIAGFFTDEPQTFGHAMPYSPVLNKKYKDQYGEELYDVIGALFLDTTVSDRTRWRYFKLVNDTFVGAFIGQIYRWCEEHRVRLTGHAVEEKNFFGQMRFCAGVMPFYEFEHIPGVDWLGREIASEMTPKQVASVAQQLCKKHVITETFACVGWDVTPRELKRIAEWQYVNGVNQMCQHLYPYSIRGQRKRDYPAFYSAHNPWMEEFRHFNEYFNTLGYMLAESREIAPALVIHPIHSAYFCFSHEDKTQIEALQARFEGLCERLGGANIGHHYADESLLAKYGSVKGKRLLVGACAYSYVLVPSMKGLDSATVKLLREFVEAGGKLYFDGEIPTLVDGEKADIGLSSNCVFEEIHNPGISVNRTDTAVRSTIRRGEFGDFIYAVNLSADEPCELQFSINAKGARLFDIEKREFRQLYFVRTGETSIVIPITFAPGQSVVIFLSSAACSAELDAPRPARVFAAPEARITDMTENCLTLDYASLSYDNETFTPPMPVMAVADKLLREKTNRTVYLKYAFEVRAKPEKIRVEAEKMNATFTWINNEALVLPGQGTLDPAFVTGDISQYLQYGKNEIVFEIDYRQPRHVYDTFNGYFYHESDATEALINCLSYETDIENVYLRGDFCVETALLEEKDGMLYTENPFRITLPRRYVTLSRLAKDGYPFFGGKLTVSMSFEAKGTETRLSLIGRYAAVRVRINGGEEKLLMFSETCDIAGEVRFGINEMTVTLLSGGRNLHGPFHLPADGDGKYVTPRTFHRFGTWKDGKSETWSDRYAFVKFGIDEIRLS